MYLFKALTCVHFYRSYCNLVCNKSSPFILTFMFPYWRIILKLFREIANFFGNFSWTLLGIITKRLELQYLGRLLLQKTKNKNKNLRDFQKLGGPKMSLLNFLTYFVTTVLYSRKYMLFLLYVTSPSHGGGSHTCGVHLMWEEGYM